MTAKRLTNKQLQSLVTYYNWLRIKYDNNGILVYNMHPTGDAGWFPVMKYQLEEWEGHEKAAQNLIRKT